MTSLVQPAYQGHFGNARAEPAAPVRPARKGLDSTRGLAAMLLAAVVAALLVAANQMVDNWSEGNLLAAWVVLWAVGFAALGLCAGTARKLALRLVSALDVWSQRVAQRRADARYLAAAMEDPRVMADLQRALDEGDEALAAPARAAMARYRSWYSHYLNDGAAGNSAAPASTPDGWLSHYAPAFNLPERLRAVEASNDEQQAQDDEASERAISRRYSGWLSHYMKAQRVEEYPSQPRAGGVWLQQF